MTDVPRAATPPEELERRVTDVNVAKSETEWWAKGEIDRLRTKLREMLEETASVAQSRERVIEENLRLRDEIVRLQQINLICPVCREDEYAYLRCNRSDCPDGRGLIHRADVSQIRREALEEAAKLVDELGLKWKFGTEWTAERVVARIRALAEQENER